MSSASPDTSLIKTNNVLGFFFFSSYTLGIKSFILEDAGQALGKY